MRSSKLVKLIELFTVKEIRAARKFLNSPYFNSDKKVEDLFEYIVKYHPELDHPGLSREMAFDYLFPGATYEYVKLRRLMSKLNKLLEKFLSIEGFLSNEVQQEQHLIRFYAENPNGYRKFKHLIEAQLEELEKQEDKRDAKYYNYLHWLNHQYYSHPQFQRNSEKSVKFFEPMKSNLELYFAHKRLSYSFDADARQELRNEQNEPGFIQKILELNNKKQLDAKTINFFIDLRKLSKGDYSKNNIDQYLLKFEGIEDSFSQSEKDIILTALINLSIKKLNRGQNQFAASLVKLYDKKIKSNLLVNAKGLNTTTYINIVFAGAKAKKYKWTSNFIDDFQPYLEVETQEVAKQFVSAYVDYSRALETGQKKYYKAALDGLPADDYHLNDYELRVRALASRIYFDYYVLIEKNNFDFVSARLDAFNNYLGRNKSLAANRREGYKNFVSVLKKLVRLIDRKKVNKKRIDNLLSEVKTKENISFKPWLEQKLGEL